MRRTRIKFSFFIRHEGHVHRICSAGHSAAWLLLFVPSTREICHYISKVEKKTEDRTRSKVICFERNTFMYVKHSRKSVCFSPTGSYLRPGGDIRLGVAGACELLPFYTFASGVWSCCTNVNRDVSKSMPIILCNHKIWQPRLPSFDSVFHWTSTIFLRETNNYCRNW